MDDINKEIYEYLGNMEPPRMCGPLICLKVFIQDKHGDLILSESKVDKYTSIVGRVVKLGPECYPKDRSPAGPRCKLGDWVTFKAAIGERLIYRGHIMQYLYDDHISSVIEDPNYVTRC